MGLLTIFAIADQLKKDMQPQPPTKGPPLPKRMGIKWNGKLIRR